jgi:ABC-type uncharacterized transport system ATPase subunit
MLIELKDIHKHFGSVKANAGVSVTLRPGTVHGILGENGAGKSTLMKILSGYSRKTSGDIRIDGRSVDFRSPIQARACGIGMLYQEPMDFQRLTVLDNFILGSFRFYYTSRRSFRKELLRVADHLGFNLDPDALISQLTVGERQQLAVTRLLYLGADVMILDEPTTGISATQRETLSTALRRLVAEGKTVILVSHKMKDVETLCDTVTVLRQGRVAGHMDRPFDKNTLLEMMFGASPPSDQRQPVAPGEILMQMDRVSTRGGRTGLKETSIGLRQGEIIGLAGLEGSGQELFLRLAAGLVPTETGSLRFRGQPATKWNYHHFNSDGVIFLPSDRMADGLIAGLNIIEHTALTIGKKRFVVSWSEAAALSVDRIAHFNIKGGPDTPADALSGGNQQRLLLSFIPKDPKLLLLENPTRGLDLASARWVWEQLRNHCEKATSIVFSSPDIDELLINADRILVFFDGRILEDIPAETADLNSLGRAIAGVV